MASKEDDNCQLCHAPKEWDLLTDNIHNVNLCERRQLHAAQAEIKKLRQSVESWKDAWFQLREIIAHLWWHHPALDDEKTYQYYKTIHQ